MDYMNHFAPGPEALNGQPVFKGTDVPLREVLARLAEGTSSETIRSQLPQLTAEDVAAAVAYAASSLDLQIMMDHLDEETIRRIDEHLIASEESGSAPMTEADWEGLKQRALSRAEEIRRERRKSA